MRNTDMVTSRSASSHAAAAGDRVSAKDLRAAVQAAMTLVLAVLAIALGYSYDVVWSVVCGVALIVVAYLTAREIGRR